MHGYHRVCSVFAVVTLSAISLAGCRLQRTEVLRQQPAQPINQRPVPVASVSTPPSRPVTWEAAVEYCNRQFAVDWNCPEELCATGCAGGGPESGCAIGCSPKDCQSFSAAECPVGWCTVMQDCSGGQRCYYKLQGERPRCGVAGYYGQDVQCCEGLVRRCGELSPDGSCNPRAGGYQGFLPYCLACGDGECGQQENVCNCPTDCPR